MDSRSAISVVIERASVDRFLPKIAMQARASSVRLIHPLSLRINESTHVRPIYSSVLIACNIRGHRVVLITLYHPRPPAGRSTYNFGSNKSFALVRLTRLKVLERRQHPVSKKVRQESRGEETSLESRETRSRDSVQLDRCQLCISLAHDTHAHMERSELIERTEQPYNLG